MDLGLALAPVDLGLAPVDLAYFSYFSYFFLFWGGCENRPIFSYFQFLFFPNVFLFLN